MAGKTRMVHTLTSVLHPTVNDGLLLYIDLHRRFIILVFPTPSRHVHMLWGALKSINGNPLSTNQNLQELRYDWKEEALFFRPFQNGQNMLMITYNCNCTSSHVRSKKFQRRLDFNVQRHSTLSFLPAKIISSTPGVNFKIKRFCTQGVTNKALKNDHGAYWCLWWANENFATCSDDRTGL